MFENLLARSAAIFRRPWPVVLLALVILVVFGAQLPHVKFDNDIRGMLPANNRERVVNNYYEGRSLFGSSDSVFIGVESDDAYSEHSLRYVKLLQDDIEALNNELPARQMAAFLKLTPEEGKKLVTALRTVGIGETNYQETLVPLVASASELKSRFGFDEAFASKVAKGATHVAPEKLFALYQNPVRKSQSLVNADYIAYEDDALVVKKLVDKGELTPENVAGLKQRVEGWPVYREALVSSDGKLSTIVVDLNSRDVDAQSAISKAVKDVIAKHQNKDFKTYLDGEVIIQDSISALMFSDIKVLLPIVAIVVLLSLLISFRSLRAVFYPAAIVVVSLAFTLGLMAWLEVPITIVSTTIPVLLVAIVAAYGIHLVNHYIHDPGTDKLAVLTQNMRSVGLAVLLSGITVMVGFGALAIEKFVPIRNFGIFTAIGDLMGVVAALYLLPAQILLTPGKKLTVHEESDKDPTARILGGLVKLNQKHSVAVLAVTAVVGALCVVGSFFVKTELNNVSFFKKSSEIRQADDYLNEKLAGTMVLNVILDSDLSDPTTRAASTAPAQPVDIVDPEVLNAIDKLGDDAPKKFPFVTKVVSFNDVLKKMNQEMNEGRPEAYLIPDNKDLISQYLLIFSGDTSSVVTANHDKLRATLYLKRVPSSDIERLRQYLQNYFSQEFKEKHHVRVEVSGSANLYNVANTLLVDGMIESIFVCIAIVLVLLVAVLRNLRMSLIAITPIVISLLVNFGALGVFEIPLNIGTAIVSSIAIGIGVDFSIHFITWYRHELMFDRDIDAALERTIVHKGRAIVYNMVVIVGGFLALTASSFVPLIQFGGLVALCMVVTAVGSLAIVPAIIRQLAKRDFEFLYLGVKAPSPAVAAGHGSAEAV